MKPTPPEGALAGPPAEPHRSPASDNTLHSAVWFGMATVFNVLAAVAAFGHAPSSALRWGVMAMAAALVATCLRRRQKRLALCETPDDLPPWVVMSPALVSVLGVGLSFGVFAGVASLTTRQWRGLDVWGGFYLWRDGAIGMAALLCLVFLALGSWQAITRPTAPRHLGRRATLLGFAVILLGPGLVLEQTSSSEPRALFIKRSLPEALARPWSDSVVLQMGTVRGDDGEDTTRTCVLLERRARVLLAWQLPVQSVQAGVADAPRDDVACGEQVQQALKSGAAAESVLLRGDLEAYFARVRSDPELLHRPIALEPARLPSAVGKPLLDLLTLSFHHAYTPFDLALATRRRADVEASLPDPDRLTLHQRQGLFELDMAGLVGAGPPRPDPVEPGEPAGQGDGRARALMLAGVMQSDNAAQGLMAMMGLSLRGHLEAAQGVGAFSALDYVMANRRCDVRYAEFLQQRGLAPRAEHAVHLVSLVGRAQYPGVSPEFQKAFPAADDSLGLPDVTRLAHCVDLARFYARHVRDLSVDPASPEDSPLGRLYQGAADAVFQWTLRDGETWRRAHGLGPRVDDVTVIGAPEIAVEVAHAVIASQPLSLDTYCHWADTWHTWLWMTQERRPQLTRVMREMAEGWRQPAAVPGQRTASCSISLPWKTNEFEGQSAGVKLLNTDLRRLGMPCQAVAGSTGGGAQLTCRLPVAAAQAADGAARDRP